MTDPIEKEVENIKSGDMSAAEKERAAKPQKTWFFKRLGDGMIFPAEAREAWDICYNRSSWKRRDFQLIGTSDGTTYNRIVKESMARARKLEPDIAAKQDELKKYMRSEEQLIMTEVVDMEGDPADTINEANKQKVLRLHVIIDRIHGQLDKLEEEFRNVSSDIVKKATDAEMKVAIKNQAQRLADGLEVDWPDMQDNIITPDTSPQGRKKILNIMQGRAL